VDRRVDKTFFKLKRIQMQAVTGQVNVVVHMQKSGGKIVTAGQLRDQGNIEKPIHHQNGYRILNSSMACLPMGIQHKSISRL
jgi:hypothetical protein